MLNTEKFMIAIIIMIITISIYFIYAGFKEIENQGGIKAVIIETGKEIQTIRKEINE